MGVRGLLSYLYNTNSFSELNLHNTDLVIDGSNLCHILYFSNPHNTIYNGEFKTFRLIIIRFFLILHYNGIRPFVVLDGCSDPYNGKGHTIHHRFLERMARSLKPLESEPSLPILCAMQFCEVAKELNIPVIQCFFEADREIAKLANFLNAPVLSGDSDFFIYPLENGIIPVNSLNFIPHLDKDITCTFPFTVFIYKQKEFVLNNSLKLHLMPLFAVICGNDFAHLSSFSSFYASLNLNHRQGSYLIICKLLRWLSQYDTVQQALDNFLSCIEINSKEELKKEIFKCLEEYKVDGDCESIYFFKQFDIVINHLHHKDLKNFSNMKLYSFVRTPTYSKITLNSEFADLVHKRLIKKYSILYNHELLLDNLTLVQYDFYDAWPFTLHVQEFTRKGCDAFNDEFDVEINPAENCKIHTISNLVSIFTPNKNCKPLEISHLIPFSHQLVLFSLKYQNYTLRSDAYAKTLGCTQCDHDTAVWTMLCTTSALLLIVFPCNKSRYTNLDLTQQLQKFLTPYEMFENIRENLELKETIRSNLNMKVIQAIAEWQSTLKALILVDQASGRPLDSSSLLTKILPKINCSTVYNLAKKIFFITTNRPFAPTFCDWVKSEMFQGKYEYFYQTFKALFNFII